jgi:hypothetical protein
MPYLRFFFAFAFPAFPEAISAILAICLSRKRPLGAEGDRGLNPPIALHQA